MLGSTADSSQRLASECGQNERCSVNVLVVVFAELLLLLSGPASKWLFQVPVCILATDHEADLARRVGRDRGVCVFDGREDLFAVFLELGDEW